MPLSISDWYYLAQHINMSKEKFPDSLSFDVFDEEDDILDFINSLEEPTKKLILSKIDHSEKENVVIYSKTGGDPPDVHMVLLKFCNPNDGGLILLLSRTENNIYSYFERLKEESPNHAKFIDRQVRILHEQIKKANSDT